MHESKRDLTPNVRGGMRVGWYFTKLFMARALLGVVVGGVAIFHGHWLLAAGMLPAYVAGGLLAGAIVGRLLPLCSTALGSAFVGFLALLPFLGLFTLLLAPMYDWWPGLLLAPPIVALPLGVGGGLILYKQPPGMEPED